MYTQCPECEVAFRVTADVLKQAAGKVRCGGCGVAFNALAHLSEEMPENAATENPPGEAGTPPQSISAEQSAALLKTLDQLAGEDIRIEDTGVEWRVIDAEEDEDFADDPVPSQVHEEMRFDDNTPLPDDFDLDTPSTPPPAPDPIVAEPEPEPQIDESQIDLVFGEPDEWEDLLDDLEEVAAEIEIAPPADDLEVVEARAIEETEFDDLEVDEPELEEPDLVEAELEKPELEEAELVASELVEPDDSASDANADLDTQFARQAEELGLDLTGMHQALDEDAIDVDEDVVLEDTDAGDEAPADADIVLELEDDDEIDRSETSIEEDLIAAAFEVEAAAKAEAELEEQPETNAEAELEDATELDAEEEFEEAVELDVEDGLEEAAELDADAEIEDVLEDESDLEEAARHDTGADAVAQDTVEEVDDGEVEDLIKAEINLDDVPPEELSRAGILDEDDYLEHITEEDEAAVLDELELEASPADQALAEALLDDEPAVDDIGDDETGDELIAEEELDDENQFADDEELAADLEVALDDLQNIEYAEPTDIEVPELTEEEKTVNMMIDQELLAIAVEDDDGFTSTIVQKQVSNDEFVANDKSNDEDVAANDVADDDSDDSDQSGDDVDVSASFPPAADDNPLMETIIMEGESVMNEEDQERLEAARAAASESLKKVDFEEEKKGFNFRDWQPPKHSAAAAAAVLFVLLVVQVIHQSREAMAVSPAFQSTLGPVYRMFGSPVIPAWDVTGWRFEATKGSTNEAGDVLTIYSRVGNNSGQPLPFPLVHVELKDRFEEVIGSRILEPSEYLVDDTDPSRPVGPKDTFNAVIAINSPSAAATSFKLNVCYRIGGGQLRCDDKDFR